MKSKIILSLLIVTFALAGCGDKGPKVENMSPQVEALMNAQTFIEMLDRGEYSKSVRLFANSNRQVPDARVADMLKQYRVPLKNIMSRRFLRMQVSNTMPFSPNAPAGQYMIVEYSAAYSTSPQRQEIVTMTLDGDGKWKVAGYQPVPTRQ